VGLAKRKVAMSDHGFFIRPSEKADRFTLPHCQYLSNLKMLKLPQVDLSLMNMNNFLFIFLEALGYTLANKALLTSAPLIRFCQDKVHLYSLVAVLHHTACRTFNNTCSLSSAVIS
jgi:hypothetical protein